MKSVNDTRGLRKEIAKLLGKSEAWLVIRMDNEGLHLHTPEEEQIALIATFLKSNPEILSVIMEMVNEEEFNISLN